MGVFTLELYRVLDLLHVELDMKGDYNGDGSEIGLGDYPIFDDDHRIVLNQKIVARYLNREIGHETIERWVHAMRRKMHEIMPAYNELYETTLIEFDTLSTINMKTTVEGTTESERSTEGTATSAADADALSRTINSDYPQFMLNENTDYATSGADANQQNKSTGEATQTESATGKDESAQETSVTGYQGSPADLILRRRAAIINVDLAILDELNSLFMVVWDNGDEWLPSNWKGLNS
jgi:hypothetical protein